MTTPPPLQGTTDAFVDAFLLVLLGFSIGFAVLVFLFGAPG